MLRFIKWVLLLGLLSLTAAVLLWVFPPTRPAGGTRVSILSWNVHGLQAESGESLADLILDGLRSANADVVAFQEYPTGRRGQFIHKRMKALGYPHEALFTYRHSVTDSYRQGMAVYFRHPILSRAEYPLLPATEGRLLGMVEIEVEGRPLRVGVVHMPNADIHINGKRAMISSELMGENLRTLQCASLLEKLRPWRAEPLALVGDFNTFPLSSAWRLVRGEYLDAFPPTEWGKGTFRIRENLDVKIDHIFHSRKVRSLEARVLQMAGSDHRPVYALLQF